MSCQYQTSMDKTGRGKCSLGLYGGSPWIGNCLACIKAGQNNQAYADKLKADYERTHPEGWRGTGTVSNCCGRADQA